MIHKSRTLTLGIVFAFLATLASCGGGGVNLPAPPVVHATPGTNNSILLGTYAFSFRGFEGNNYVVAVGTITFDGNGNIVSGTQQRTEQGGFQFQFSLSGTYAVNSDGTGTISMIFFRTSVDTWSIVVLANGQKIKMVNIEPNNFRNGALIGEMEKQ